jgi:hypothetical protein
VKKRGCSFLHRAVKKIATRLRVGVRIIRLHKLFLPRHSCDHLMPAAAGPAVN